MPAVSLALVLALTGGLAESTVARTPAPAEGDSGWPLEHTEPAPGPIPNGVQLIPGDNAAREAAVTWRTEVGVVESLLELGLATDGPALAEAARRLRGSSTELVTAAGLARQHQVRLERLHPDTLYAYRVRGERTWSQWFQFRTAPVRSD